MKHIAILKQPFFDMVMNGTKTIESRWSMKKVAPYSKIKKGDTIYLKQTGKDIVAKTTVGKVKFYELDPNVVEQIRQQYGSEIGTDYFKDWAATLNKRYCTLIWLGNIKKIEPIIPPRSHGAGWIILDN